MGTHVTVGKPKLSNGHKFDAKLLIFCLSIDVNECIKDTHLCHHNCINTVGSYLCDCDMGFKLESDGLTCTGKNP